MADESAIAVSNGAEITGSLIEAANVADESTVAAADGVETTRSPIDAADGVEATGKSSSWLASAEPGDIGAIGVSSTTDGLVTDEVWCP